MSLTNLSVKHGQTLEQARARLDETVRDVCGRFSVLVRGVDRDAQQDLVKIRGAGFEIELRVDAQDVHLRGDTSILSSLLGNQFVTSVKGALERTFQKRLK